MVLAAVGPSGLPEAPVFQFPHILRLPAVLGLLVLSGWPAALSAQAVRGTVRTATGLLPIAGARMSLLDEDGTVRGRTETDALGHFVLRVPGPGAFEVEARRLGYAPMTSKLEPIAPGDTAELEFLMADVAAVAEAVMVTAEPSLNDRRLLEARRRGWRIYPPERVALHRERSQDFLQLLQAIGTVGLILPKSISECIRATRNNQCLTYVVDNQVLGPSAFILPSDIYFFAVLGASESRIQFGDRAPWGAIAIYTRSRTDRPTTRRPD
jgi:hypothetical protein